MSCQKNYSHGDTYTTHASQWTIPHIPLFILKTTTVVNTHNINQDLRVFYSLSCQKNYSHGDTYTTHASQWTIPHIPLFILKRATTTVNTHKENTFFLDDLLMFAAVFCMWFQLHCGWQLQLMMEIQQSRNDHSCILNDHSCILHVTSAMLWLNVAVNDGDSTIS